MRRLPFKLVKVQPRVPLSGQSLQDNLHHPEFLDDWLGVLGAISEHCEEATVLFVRTRDGSLFDLPVLQTAGQLKFELGIMNRSVIKISAERGSCSNARTTRTTAGDTRCECSEMDADYARSMPTTGTKEYLDKTYAR